MTQSVPAGYRLIAVAGGYAMAADGWADWVRQKIADHGSLDAYARREPGSRPVRGRGTAYLVTLGGADAGLVRWLRHGGLLAPLTADRFLRSRRPRPINELLTAVYLEQQGIATPAVLAACVYPSFGWYQGEVLRTFHTGCTDLAAFLYAAQSPAQQRREAVAEAARMAGRLADAGVVHRDFNAMNLLVKVAPAGVSLLVIDLEKSTSCPSGCSRARARMLRRLEGSLRKAEAHSSQRLPADAWETLAAGSTRA